MKKYKSAVRFFVFLLVLQMLLPFPIFADTIGKFNEVRGDVSLTRAKKGIKPNVGYDVQTKDIVVTGDKSRAKLLLADDSMLSINQNSNVEITEFLLYKNKRSSIISLRAGAMHTKVERFLDPNSKFEVHTPTAVAGARGTAWLTLVELAAQNVAQTSIFALEQAVTVYNPLLPSQVVTVAAGNFTVVAAGVAPTIPAAFAPAAIQGFMGQLGAQVPVGTAGAGTTGAAGTAGAGAAGAGAGAGVGAGIGAGTVAAGVAGAAAVVAGVAAISSSSSSSSTTTTHHH
jgi:hypothetical protein